MLNNDNCICCGEKTTLKAFKFNVSDVFICKNSCIFSKPKVDTNSLYSSEYFKQNYNSISIAQEKKSRLLFSFIKQYISEGSILDYGCGTGTFLKCAEEEGFKENAGVDVSDYSISVAKSKTKHCTYFFNGDTLSSKKFDCISFIDSIAHIETINDTLSNLIHSHLNTNGLILIRTPNINQLYIFYVTLLRFILPNRYLSSFFFIPNRLFLFNKKSISLFLGKHNLSIVKLFFESDYKRPSSHYTIRSFFKHFIQDILRFKIPRLINSKNSMTVIAKLGTAN
tara:strand:- start:465 stop:1310 length:846 start_codon:yes stop_codon:yes gene_type:complete